MLCELTIKNYRCFKDLEIKDLAKVNLIVGMNNNGKTSLLEAIYLLANRNTPWQLITILHRRGEIIEDSTILDSDLMLSDTSDTTTDLNRDFQHLIYQIKHIFHGHHFVEGQLVEFRAIQSDKSPLSLILEISSSKDEESKISDEDEKTLELVIIHIGPERASRRDLPIDSAGYVKSKSFQRLKQHSSRIPSKTIPKSVFLTTNQVNFKQLASLWDKITLTPKEDKLIEALKILEPSIDRISFTSHQTFNSGILLKIRGQDEPIPLGSMGDGMRRILTLVMAAVTVEGGFLLVDEIDTGLHYQVQTEMWRLILEIAQQLDIQVFATTHSWDCIAAFEEALSEAKDRSIGKLFRLSKRGEEIRAIKYTTDDLTVAMRQSIEVR